MARKKRSQGHKANRGSSHASKAKSASVPVAANAPPEPSASSESSAMAETSAPVSIYKHSDTLEPFGEMGRCLLSSTMLQNGRGIRATFEHFERAGLSSRGRASSRRNQEHARVSKTTKGSSPMPRPASSGSQDAELLRHELVSEFADFMRLAHDDVALLTTKLEQQRRHNLQVRKRALRRQSRPSHAATTTAAIAAARAKGTSRWRTPLRSGYDSDSTTASTNTSATTLETADLDQAGRSSSRGEALFRQVLQATSPPRGDEVSSGLLSSSELRSQAQSVLALLAGKDSETTEGSSAVQVFDAPKREVIVAALNLLQRHLDGP